MELGIIVIFGVLILVETTILLVRNLKEKPFSRGEPRRKVYVDSSALMDGRILAVAKTGFIGDEIIIPRSVIREMQLLADGKDSEKRARARYGLDNVNEIERVVYFNTTILQDALDRTPVDERLIELAKENHGMIFTNDFNLNKVATTEEIEVLNVNELATVLVGNYLPGEKFKVKITGTGSGPRQGIGHLADGTMVVVDNAKTKVGKMVEIELLRFHQTEAGRMAFGKIVRGGKNKNKNKK